MHTYAHQSSDQKSQDKGLPKQENIPNAPFQFIDHRPEAIAQRKLQKIMANSPNTKQLMAFKEIAQKDANSPAAAQRKVILDKASRGTDANGAQYATVKTSGNFDTNHLVSGTISDVLCRTRGATRNLARNTLVQESQLENAILAKEDAIIASTATDNITQLDFPVGTAKQWIKNVDQVYATPQVGVKARMQGTDIEIHHIHESTVDVALDNDDAWPSL